MGRTRRSAARWIVCRMILRVLAPMKVDLFLAPNAGSRTPEDTEAYWDGVASALRASDCGFLGGASIEGEESERAGGAWPHRSAESAPGPRIVLHHRQRRSPYNRYRTIDQDALERPLELVRMIVPKVLLRYEPRTTDPMDASLRACSEALLANAIAVEVTLHDHGIGLLDASFDLGETASRLGWSLDDDDLDVAQRAVVDLTGSIVDQIQSDAIDPLLAVLTRVGQSSNGFVSRYGDTGPRRIDRVDDGYVMWTARALVVDRNELEADRDAVRRQLGFWIKDAPQDDVQVLPSLRGIVRDLHVIARTVAPDAEAITDQESLEDRLVSGDMDHVARWLNYAYVLGGNVDDDTIFLDQWTALRDAQMFYAALDRVDDDLDDVLSRALGARSDRELRTLREELDRTSHRALLVEMSRSNAVKYLKRSVLAEMEQILSGWVYDELLKDAVAQKVEACRERLDYLKAQRQERLGVYTDVILFTIGITAILGTALGLVELGRVTASDPSLGAYDVGREGLAGWFSSQPLDAIVVASLLLSVLLLLVYVAFRRRQQ